MEPKIAMKWNEYPKKKPSIGDEIVVCYPSGGGSKKEIITWTFKYAGTTAKFQWIKLPPNKIIH